MSYACKVHGEVDYYENATGVRKGRRRCKACFLDGTKPRPERRDYFKAWNVSAAGRSADLKRRTRDKARVIAAYGGKCLCCSEMNEAFLSIDHVGDNGAAHRKEIGQSKTYQWLRLNGFPKDGFQLLCHNCNRGRWINGGECPHKSSSPLSAKILRFGFIGRSEPFRTQLTAGG